jgi:hypothetical protein
MIRESAAEGVYLNPKDDNRGNSTGMIEMRWNKNAA